MPSDLNEEVQKLCRAIPEEKDPDEMMKLVQQLNQLLDAEEAERSVQLTLKPSDDPSTEPGPDNIECASQVDLKERKSA